MRRCKVCNEKIEQQIYMVHDWVWCDEAGLSKDDNVHLDCFQKKFRVLRRDDFTEAPCNNAVFFSDGGPPVYSEVVASVIYALCNEL